MFLDSIETYTGWDGKGQSKDHYSNHVVYKYHADTNKYVNTTNPNDSFDASTISYSWVNGYQPNTNWQKITSNGIAATTGSTLYAPSNPNAAEQTQPGESLPGNSKYRLQYTIGNTGHYLIDNTSGWLNQYFNFYGAKEGTAQTYKQGQDISGISQDEFRKLIDVTDLGANGWNGQNINANAPQVLAYLEGTDSSRQFAMTWAPDGMPSTAAIANNVPGTVRILFNDGTYLDVPALINVIADNNAGKPDHDKTSFNQKISYQYQGHEVASYTIADIAKNSSLSAADLKNAINGNLPANYSIADGYTYPGAENNITTQPAVLIVPLKQSSDQHHHSNYNATVTVTYYDNTTAAHTPLKTKDGQNSLTFSFNKTEGLKATTLKTDIDSQVPTNWKVDTTHFTYPGDQTDNATIKVPLVHATKTVNPGDEPTNKDLHKTVTRTINVYKPESNDISYTDTQPVSFERTGVLDLVTNKFISFGNWTVSGSVKGWAEYDVPTKTGYISHVNGGNLADDATIIPANKRVTAKTADQTINITYSRTTPTEENFSQDIVYKTADGTVVKTARGAITGTLSNGTATVAANDVNNKIDSNMPSGYDYVSGKLSAAETVNSTTPTAVTVIVKTHASTPTEENTTVTYTFYDDTDNTTVGTPVVVSGKPGTSQATGLVIPDGYKLAEGQTLPTTVTMPDTDIEVTIHLVHGTTTITPGGTPGVTPDNPDYSDLYKTVTRTIIVKNPLTGNDETHKQAVKFSRSKTIDSVTKALISYGAWTPATGTWDEFDAPEFAGYTPSQAKVDEETVTADTKDTTVVISYNKNGNGGNTNPTNPSQPGNGDHNTNPGNNDNGQPSTNNNGNGNNGQLSANNNGNGNGNGLKNESVQNNNGQKNTKQALPQTGNTNSAAAIAGLGLVSLTAMLGLGGLKKKND